MSVCVCVCVAEQIKLYCSHLITIFPLIGSSLSERFLRTIISILSPRWWIHTAAQKEPLSLWLVSYKRELRVWVRRRPPGNSRRRRSDRIRVLLWNQHRVCLLRHILQLWTAGLEAGCEIKRHYVLLKDIVCIFVSFILFSQSNQIKYNIILYNIQKRKTEKV